MIWACWANEAPPNAVPVITKLYSNIELFNPDSWIVNYFDPNVTYIFDGCYWLLKLVPILWDYIGQFASEVVKLLYVKIAYPESITKY